MSNYVALSGTSKIDRELSNPRLAAAITKSASKQTFYIVQFLVDRERVCNAYRAYAYFRWVDDTLDEEGLDKAAGLAFVNRQKTLLDNGYRSGYRSGYRGDWPTDLSAEECILADLIQSDTEPNSGLQIYLQNMMAVMTFDAERRGRLISQQELTSYTHLLASAVTEALHYFIGHNGYSPKTEARYLAASAAHIVHMLRDTSEDTAVGYYNIPREYLDTHHIGPEDIESQPYRNWVQAQVQLARRYFDIGQDYLAQVQSTRCRAAGYLYAARFDAALNAIERDEFLLRETYPECKTPQAGMRILWSMLSKTFTRPRQQPISRPMLTE